MIVPNVLSEVLEDLDNVRAQVREARATERTTRLYRLVRARPAGAEPTQHVANVIELSGGWVVVRWLQDPQAVSLYSGIASTRQALSTQGYSLVLDEIAERTSLGPPRPDSGQTRLIPSERRVLRELRRGGSNREIAIKLGLSESTVKNHLTDLYRKLGADVCDRLQAVMLTRDWNLEDDA